MINLSFGKAIQEWNKHEYEKAVTMFRKHMEEYPDSPWVSEAILHIGCDAHYNGRYAEAEESFKWIPEENKFKDYEGAKRLKNKLFVSIILREFLNTALRTMSWIFSSTTTSNTAMDKELDAEA